MKHILFIATKDIAQILRDKLTFLFLLAMPILFTVMFGFAFGGLNSGPADQRAVVGIQDRDHSPVSRGLRSLLENQPSIRVEARDGTTAELEQLVTGEKLAAVVIVPAGYGQALEAGRPLPLEVIVDQGRPEGLTARGAIQSAAGRAAGAAAAAGGGGPSGFTERFDAAAAAWLTPPARLVVTGGEGESGPGGSFLPISHTAPAMMIQFALAGLLTAAQVLVHERKARCMQRLLTTRAARHEILLGHFLAIFGVITAQFVLLVGFGQVILGLNYLRLPLGALGMVLCTSLFVAAVGLLIGSLARSDEQAVIMAMVPMFVLSGLGGAWVPLETAGEAFRTVGQVTPVALALDGFTKITASGAGAAALLLPAAGLLGYALACFGLAAWKFKFE